MPNLMALVGFRRAMRKDARVTHRPWEDGTNEADPPKLRVVDRDE
jgi:hypothetical protein